MPSQTPNSNTEWLVTENSTPAVKHRIAPLVPVAIFVALCCSVLPYCGMQADETLFAGPLYSYIPHDLSMRAFHHNIPLMLMSYLGTAKTWLFALIFRLWQPGVFSLRIPMVALGALTLFALYRLICRSIDRTTAFVLCALLATDATFVLTTTFDWGPVAIQHLAYISGLLFVLRGFQQRSSAAIAAGFAMFGLGMWDKAIFIWMLSGSAVAVCVFFRLELIRTISLKNVLAAILGFLIGAAPLIVYNIRNPLQTFHGNAVFSTAGLDNKIEVLMRALSGSALFGYVVNEEAAESPKLPRNGFERTSVALRDLVGERRQGLLFYALGASLLAAPVWWRPRRRPVLFALTVITIAWLQMALVKDAGTGVHHPVLLWPLPHLVVAVALVECARRLPRGRTAVLAAGLSILCMANVLVVNQYLCQLIRNGATPYWTDAILPLSNKLDRWKDRQILMLDWGMEPTLRMLHRGNLKNLWNVSDIVSHELSAADRIEVDRMFLIHAIFLTHTPKFEIQTGSIRRVLEVAAASGYRRELLATIGDSNGRPAFEVAEFVK